MAPDERTERKSRLRALAKQALDRSEYVLLRNAWVSFAKTKSVGTLCSELIGILNTPEKAGLLAEVKLLLPEGVHQEFLQQCRHYQAIALQQKSNRAPPHDSKGAERKRKNGEKKTSAAFRDYETENRVPNRQEDMKYKSKDGKGQCGRKKTGSSCASRRPEHQSVANFDCAEERKESRRSIKEGGRTVTLSRLKDQDFGFRLVGEKHAAGGMFVHKVFRNSLADQQGLRVGDKVICVNGLFLDGAWKDEIAKLIKTAKKLHLKILSEENDEVGRDQACVTMATNGTSLPDGCSVRDVAVHADESGWLGCSIRGGSDYGCDVRIISVKDGSPAKRAGLSKGDFIVKVNNHHTSGLTHIQVVRLIVTAAPPVIFTIRAGKPRNQQPAHHHIQVASNQDGAGQPTTPLRFCGAGNSNLTPPNSPPYPHSCPPSYSSQLQEQPNYCYNDGNFASSSHLPLHAINLNQTPPPPYTTELPSTHRLLDEGVCQRHPPLRSANTSIPIVLQSGTPLSTLPLPPFPSPLPLPTSPSLLHQSLLSSLPPPPSPAVLDLLGRGAENFPGVEYPEESDRRTECHASNRRKSLLCQIREFNKCSLKSAFQEATHSAREHTENSRETAHDSTEDTGGQRDSNGSDFLSLFNQALQDRARVLNTASDCESEESDSDWEF